MNPNFDWPRNDTYCAHDYWSCLFFTNTLYTTIGYGTIAPCTMAGRIFTMIYTICGIPVTLVTVANLGFLMAKWSGVGWRKLRIFWRSLAKLDYPHHRVGHISQAITNQSTPVIAITKIHHTDEIEKRKYAQRTLLPFPLAILICVNWILLSALYFYLCELFWGKRWSYFEAFYYFVVSVTTLGLGDYDPSREYGQRTILDFFFIIIGISLFSMCINIIQYDVEHLSIIVGESIMEDYGHALGEGHALGIFAASAAAASNDTRRSDRDRKAAKYAARMAIRKLIHRKSNWLTRLFVSSGFEDRLLDEYRKYSHMRLASTQTENTMNDVETMTTPDMNLEGKQDKWTTTRDFITRHNSRVQVPDMKFRELDALERHMRRMSTAQVKRREDMHTKLEKTLSTPAVPD